MKKIQITLLTLCLMLLCNNYVKASDEYCYKLTEFQQRNADIIAQACIDHWDEYGCLPSVAIAQAYVESQLGLKIDNGNLWGICSCRISYPSVYDGVHAYMRVINNGRYIGAPHEKKWRIQIRRILDGDYCIPEGDCENDVAWTIRTFKLEKYDEILFKKINKIEHFNKKGRGKRVNINAVSEQNEKIIINGFCFNYEDFIDRIDYSAKLFIENATDDCQERWELYNKRYPMHCARIISDLQKECLLIASKGR